MSELQSGQGLGAGGGAPGNKGTPEEGGDLWTVRLGVVGNLGTGEPRDRRGLGDSWRWGIWGWEVWWWGYPERGEPAMGGYPGTGELALGATLEVP